MVQVAWAAIGLLAVAVFGMFGAFFYLGAKIDGVNGRVDSLSARIDALGERLDARIDSLAALLQAHIERHAG